jgi:hypothetical protein
MAKALTTPNKTTNKWDYEIAKMKGAVDLWRIVAYGGVIALCIGASALPLWMMHGIIQPLAGKKTEVDLSVPISIALGLSVVVNVGQHIKGRSRRAEIKRQRVRAEKHEWTDGVTSS